VQTTIYDHYGCAAYDEKLSTLQVAKLNAAIRLGWPLKRWLNTDSYRITSEGNGNSLCQ